MTTPVAEGEAGRRRKDFAVDSGLGMVHPRRSSPCSILPRIHPKATGRGWRPRGPPAPAGRGPTGHAVATASPPPARGGARFGSGRDHPADSPCRPAARRPTRRSRRGPAATIAPRIAGSRPVIGATRRLTVNFGKVSAVLSRGIPPGGPAGSGPDKGAGRSHSPRSRAGAIASRPGAAGSPAGGPARSHPVPPCAGRPSAPSGLFLRFSTH
jgi:hypothetical protein